MSVQSRLEESCPHQLPREFGDLNSADRRSQHGDLDARFLLFAEIPTLLSASIQRDVQGWRATNPSSLSSIERAAGYAVPLLRSGLEIDPMDSLLLGTALTRSGATSTKSGTWLREMALRAMPGTSMMSKLAFRKHEEALTAFGLVDVSGGRARRAGEQDRRRRAHRRTRDPGSPRGVQGRSAGAAESGMTCATGRGVHVKGWRELSPARSNFTMKWLRSAD